MGRPDERLGYPILLAPVALEKVWGGTTLARRFPDLVPARTNVGEAWVVWDGLVVKNGDFAGKRLGELFADFPLALLGPAADVSKPTAFPLLVKFLDARENLSVQVHPDDGYARAHEGQPFGKCEMWYVLETSGDASVFHGLRRDLTEDEVATALAGRAILEVVDEVAVRPGDVLINTPGVVHALGEGVVIFELQQSCDLTYRLYDWDRTAVGGVPRALHLDQGVAVADRRALRQHKITPVTIQSGPVRRDFLAACQYFAAELVMAPAGETIALSGGRLDLLTVLEGSIKIRSSEPKSAWYSVGSGQTCLLPAAVRHGEALCSVDCRLIRSFIPDLIEDIVNPLRARGVSDDEIAQLGGELDRSDLWSRLRTL